VLAGEASGDILGSHLLQALRQHCDELVVEGIGGPLMEAQGLHSMFPMERLSVMGLVEPLKRLPELLHIRRTVYRHFRDNPPDVFLGIDAPDFNLHLEQKLRAAGVTTAHLVSPSVWAWRRGRIRKIKRAVDLMLTLFPFETAVYEEHGVPVAFVGHPLADQIPMITPTALHRQQLGLASDRPLLALLPGSRRGELRLLAPLFLQVARVLHRQRPALGFVLPAANAARHAELQVMLHDYPDLPLSLLTGHSRETMAAADAVLLASGTATLEALLLKKPMVIAYKLGAFTWWLVSRLVRTAYVGLPNILAGRPLVPELLQHDATVDALVAAVTPLLDESGARHEQLSAYHAIHEQLRLASGERTARCLLQLVEQKGHG
jgi:lipid-A-disaccharide synthase